MPAVVVGDERERRVADLRFARELRFLQVRHADDVEARRRGRRSTRRSSRTAAPPCTRRCRPVHGRAGVVRRVEHDVAQRPAERMREPDVRDEAVAEERADAPARAIEELIGHDEVERLVVLAQAADRARREDPLDAEHLEAVDVGAEVQLRRQQPVPARRAAPETRRAGRAASPRTYGADGSPNGVATVRSSRSVSSAMSYRPEPPMMPMVMGAWT